MEELLLFIFSSVGATLIITLSYVFKPVREFMGFLSPKLGKLFSCPQCMGFWVGLIVKTLFMIHDHTILNIDWSDLYLICYGFTSSFFSYAIYLLLCPFIKKYD